VNITVVTELDSEVQWQTSAILRQFLVDGCCPRNAATIHGFKFHACCDTRRRNHWRNGRSLSRSNCTGRSRSNCQLASPNHGTTGGALDLNKEINLGNTSMQIVYNNLYSMAGVAGQLPPDRQIAMLGKLVEMLEKALARGPKSTPRSESGLCTPRTDSTTTESGPSVPPNDSMQQQA
jgi:hypothetical protein